MESIVTDPLLNPFSEDRLSPQHLALLFPATFYQNDESLALHLTESCLVETTTWDDDCAIGETAFWLKVLSTPQSDYLKQQKRLFKTAIAAKCRGVRIKENTVVDDLTPNIPALPTVIEVTTGNPPKPKKPRMSNASKTITRINPSSMSTAEIADIKGINSTYFAASQNHKQTLDSVASPTPGFGLNSYKCKLCSFATDTRERLNHHQKRTHAAERPFSCEYCDYTSRYSWNIKTHIDNVHLKTKRFKCEHCDFYSPQACLLRRHVTRVHTNARDVKCEFCDYRTNHKDVLRRHVHMKHTGEFDHRCPYCSFGRDAKYEVEDHINAIHLKKVIYQCSECNFQTYRKISLRSHHKDHETKQLLMCPSCDTKSIYPSTMAKHIREEHPELPLPKELKDARRKVDQKNIISGDVDYTPILMCKCKLCDFTCERIVKLKSHVRRVHGQGARNLCPVCRMSFANKRNLKNHLSKQHPGVDISVAEALSNEQAVSSADTNQGGAEDGVHAGEEAVDKAVGAVTMDGNHMVAITIGATEAASSLTEAPSSLTEAASLTTEATSSLTEAVSSLTEAVNNGNNAGSTNTNHGGSDGKEGGVNPEGGAHVDIDGAVGSVTTDGKHLVAITIGGAEADTATMMFLADVTTEEADAAT